MKSDKNAIELTEAKIEEAIDRMERGEVRVVSFLTPREKRIAQRILRQRGAQGSAWFWGGYPDADRVCLFLLPWHLTECLENTPEHTDHATMESRLEQELAEAVTAVRITGSGYRRLTHRDFLGSILGLGIERDALGDLAVQSEREAVLFCPPVLAKFLIEMLEKVANDKVKCRPYTIDESFTDGRVYQPMHETVASPRLDCIVAALTNLSRDDAQTAIRSGYVEVEYEEELRVDHIPAVPATVSIRGFGKYILRSFDGETKRGRLRLKADKLV